MIFPKLLMMHLLTHSLALSLCTVGVEAFSWDVSKQRVFGDSLVENPTDTNHDASPLPRAYALALNELQELESEPLCHRNAARLLVNHCQLLDEKDEATVLTDSGRVARDFVDSYAASLAICDLERGSFRIPSVCAQFREDALMRLPVPKKPELHVTTKEIDSCLEGLAQSDSAWNTWVSYRHKASRFCDAARADNEKDGHIRLYQRVTSILSKLTTDIEEHMKTRLVDIDNAIHRTNSKLEDLNQGVGSATAGLKDLEHMVSTGLYKTAEESLNVMFRASTDAHALQDLLATVLQDMTHRSEDMATIYDTALETFNARASSEAEVIMKTLAGMMSVSNHLQNELATSHTRAEEVAKTQERVEENMRNLELQADGISARYDEHGEQLRQAQNSADQILSTLDAAATSASTFTSSFSNAFAIQGWWPYIYCPVASLMMGSYGLPPSAVRNVALVGLGEVAGFFVSNVSTLFSSLSAITITALEAAVPDGNTTSFQEVWWPDVDIINDDLRKRRHVRAF